MKISRNRRARIDLELLEERNLPSVSTLLIAETITHSQEANAVTIKDMYQDFLKRTPSAQELSSWVQSLTSGFPIEQVEAGFLDSSEYLQDHGGAGQNWLQGIYQDLLGRTASQTELTGWLDYLATGHNAGQVALGFTTSIENVQDRITADYTLYLGRLPAATDVAAWTKYYVAGMQDQDIAAQFINSSEFINQVSEGDDRTWLTNSYQDALQRPIGETEIAYWMTELGFVTPTAPATVPAQNVSTSNPSGSSSTGKSGGSVTVTTPVTTTPSPDSTPTVDNTFSADGEQVNWSIGDYTAQPVVFAQILVSSSTPSGGAASSAGAAAKTFTFSLDIDLQQDGSFTDAGDQNWFKITVQEGVPQDADITMPGSGNFAVRPGLKDASGNETNGDPVTIHVAFADDDPDSSAPGDGGASAGGNDGGLGQPSGATGAIGSSGSSNGTHGPAEPDILNLTPGTPTIVSGAITTSAPIETYTFTITQKTGLFLSVISRETGLSTTLDSTLSLLNSSNTQIDYNDNGYDFVTGWPAPAQDASSTTGDSDMYDDLQPGNYTLNVGSVGGSTGNFELRADPEVNYSTTVPVLNSDPGAKATIYLDFLGYTASDDWGSYTMLPYHINGGTGNVFSPGDQLAIQNMWQVASEDFSPFNVNVTTSYSGTYNDQQAMRCVITNSDGTNIGETTDTLGVAFEGSFSMGGASDKVCFVFHANFSAFDDFGGGTSGEIEAISEECANDISHEDGHTLGLIHYNDETVNGAEPIMETPHVDLHRGLWWAGSTNSNEPPVIYQDDMAIISGPTNGYGYKVQTVGNSVATATALTPSGLTYSTAGILAQLTETDVYSFETGGNGAVTVSVTVDPYCNDFNSKILVEDAAGNVVGSDDNPNSFDSTVTVNLPAGTYYVLINSKGGNGEAGHYNLTVTVPSITPPTPPGGGGASGGGGNGSGGSGNFVFLGDIGNTYDNSDKALRLGTYNPGATTYLGMSLKDVGNIDEQDFYRWTMSTTGPLTVSLAYPGSNGSIQFYAYEVNSDNSLTEIGSGTNYSGSSQSATMNVTAGQDIIVYVFGFNFATGAYQMTLSLA